MPQPNRISRPRLRLPVILALAVSLTGASQTLPAQAARAGDYSYRVVAALDKPKATICVGNTVTAAVRAVIYYDDQELGATRASVWVEGAVQNPNVGQFVVARRPVGWNSDRPQEAVFAFHANHAGKTTLTFKAEVRYYKSVLFKWLYGPAEYVNSNPVEVMVVNCKYQVLTTSIWKVPGEGYTANLTKWTDLTMDADGTFHGTGTAHWSGFWQVVPPGAGSDVKCVTTLTAPDSPVTLSGKLDTNSNLVITIHFVEVVAPSWHAVCGPIPPTDNAIRLAPQDLNVILPKTGYGGFVQAQELTDMISGGRGHTTVLPVAVK